MKKWICDVFLAIFIGAYIVVAVKVFGMSYEQYFLSVIFMLGCVAVVIIKGD